jgi:ferritin-like metal-binding protein YciE
MANQTPEDVIKRYLQDAIAAEKSFETQLRSFAQDADRQDVRDLFETHADETKLQHERLTSRLDALGESPSGGKSFLAHLLGMAPKTAQLGHEQVEKTTQNLMMAYGMESAECAMYEAMAAVARRAGDAATEQLAQEIGEQERQTALKVWDQIGPCAIAAYDQLTVPGRRAA